MPLKRKSLECTKCVLHETCLRVKIPADLHGHSEVDILFVGEAPGAEEDAQGVPFIGQSGQYLRGLIDMQVRQHPSVRIGITNAVRCRPPANRRPLPKEVLACSDYLKEEIGKVRPKVVVALGDVAARTLTGAGRVVADAGKVRPLALTGQDVPVVVTVHPSYVLRTPDYASALSAQIAKAFALATRPEADLIVYQPIRRVSEVPKILVDNPPVVAFDYETTGLDPHTGELRCVSICPKAGISYSLDLRDEGLREWFKGFLQNPKVSKITHNGFFEYIWTLKHFKTHIAEWAFDTMIAEHCINENSPKSLGDLAVKYTSMPAYKKDYDWKTATFEDLWRYNCSDADATFQAAQEQRERHPTVCSAVARSLSYTRALALMNYHGFPVNEAGLADAATFVETERARLLGELRSMPCVKEAIEGELNPDSTPQLRKVVFDTLRFQATHTTDKGMPSIGKEFIEDNEEEHPFIETLAEYRRINQLRKNFVSVLPKFISSKGIHPRWNISGTRTWRISCEAPNLQNIPKAGTGDAIRRVFLPCDGGVLVEADYSQIELRVLASLAGESTLISAFNTGEDIHARTAAEVLGKRIQDITPEDRQIGKRFNFAVVYGSTEFNLAKKMHIPIEEAKKLLDRLWERMPKVQEFMDAIKEEVKSTGEVVNVFGRVRHLPEVHSDNRKMRGHALKQACNFPIQSAAAEICLQALTKLSHSTVADEWTVHAQVHDSIVVTIVYDDHRNSRLELLRQCMESVKPTWFKVPLKADIKIGPNWGDMKEWSSNESRSVMAQPPTLETMNLSVSM